MEPQYLRSPLANLFAQPVTMPFGTVTGFDGVDTNYQFQVYDIDACPAGAEAVYIFAKFEAGIYVPIYIGRAESLSQRLSGHERRAEAIRLGARYLLVHTPGRGARVAFDEAERRLIHHYAPALNQQFNPWF